MGKPYSDLEKRALAVLAGGGNPATSQDEELRNYWQWRVNPRDSSHNLPEASTRTAGRKLDTVAIEPFSITLITNLFAAVTISQRTNNAAVAAVKTACGFRALAAEQKSLPIKRFTPARVYWRTGEAATSANRTSRITKRNYKSYYAAGDEGYSAPFGKVGTDSVDQRQVAIAAALGNTIQRITFSPEKYRKPVR